MSMTSELTPSPASADVPEEVQTPEIETAVIAGAPTAAVDGHVPAGQLDDHVAATRPFSRPQTAGITVADGLMALVGVIAAVLRFGELARLPLSAAEAANALGSWQYWSAGAQSYPVSSPAYFAFTNLVMGLGGDSDAAARLAPALFGLLTVLAPWLLRGRVRPAMFLVAGLFMAASPILVTVSRTAGGDAIALFALMLLFIAVLNLQDGGRGWALAAGASLGLGLASTPLFYTGLVALLSAAALGGLPGARSQALSTRQLRPAAAAAAVTFAAVATSLLLYPAGIGAALRLFPAWLAQFGLPSGEAGLANGALSPVLALLRYEPAAMLLGVAAMIWAGLRRRPLSVLLALWLGLTLALSLFQPGTLVNAAAALLPAYLLVGLLAVSMDVEAHADWSSLSVTVALVALSALALVAVARFVRLGLLTGGNGMTVSLLSLAFALAAGAVVLAMVWDNQPARRGAFLGVALVLLVWQWGSAFQLSRLGANDPRERWVIAGTDDDVRVMDELLTSVSRQLTNSDHDLLVFSQVDSPVLRWYLRDYENFAAGPAVPFGSQAAVIITPLDVTLALPSDYFGADFALEQREVAAPPGSLTDTLKWWLFRESGAPVETQRVVLWIRSDLAAPE